jgi:hypothetical protein
MRTKIVVVIAMLALLAGCSMNKSTTRQGESVPQVTRPNGRSPASDNAPHTASNDTEELRSGFDYGNGVLYVKLPPDGEIVVAKDHTESDGTYRVKIPWWRAAAGEFRVEGRRLDAPAPPLRAEYHVKGYGESGFLACVYFFPSEGYWEITGHIDDKSLTYIVHVIKVST